MGFNVSSGAEIVDSGSSLDLAAALNADPCGVLPGCWCLIADSNMLTDLTADKLPVGFITKPFVLADKLAADLFADFNTDILRESVVADEFLADIILINGSWLLLVSLNG